MATTIINRENRPPMREIGTAGNIISNHRDFENKDGRRDQRIFPQKDMRSGEGFNNRDQRRDFNPNPNYGHNPNHGQQQMRPPMERGNGYRPPHQFENRQHPGGPRALFREVPQGIVGMNGDTRFSNQGPNGAPYPRFGGPQQDPRNFNMNGPGGAQNYFNGSNFKRGGQFGPGFRDSDRNGQMQFGRDMRPMRPQFENRGYGEQGRREFENRRFENPMQGRDGGRDRDKNRTTNRRSRSSQRRKSGSRGKKVNDQGRKRFSSKDKLQKSTDKKIDENQTDQEKQKPKKDRSTSNQRQKSEERSRRNQGTGHGDRSAYYQSDQVMVRRDRNPKMYINIAKSILKDKHDVIEIHGAGELSFFGAIKVAEVLTRYGYADIIKLRTKYILVQNYKVAKIMIKVKKSADFDKLFDAFNEEVAKNRLNGVGYRFSKPKSEKDAKVVKGTSISGDEGVDSGSTQTDKGPKPDGAVSSSDTELNNNKAPSDQAVIDEEEGVRSGQDGSHSEKDGDEGDDEGDLEQLKHGKRVDKDQKINNSQDEEAIQQDHDEGVQTNATITVDLTNQE